MYPTIVSPEWLLDNINSKDICIYDVTFFEKETVERAQRLFYKEHIVNSFQLLLRGRDYSAQFFLRIPRENTFNTLLLSQGFKKGKRAILYDRDGKSALKSWWLFHYFSFIQVSILDGGYPEWKSRQMPIELKKIVQLPPSEIKDFAGKARDDILVEQMELRKFLVQTKRCQLNDFKQHQEQITTEKVSINEVFRNTSEFSQIIDARIIQTKSTQSVPGAIHLPYTLFFADDKVVTDILKIKQIFREHSINIDQQIVIYGESGLDAIVLTLICYLYSGRGMRGIKLLRGTINDFWAVTEVVNLEESQRLYELTMAESQVEATSKLSMKDSKVEKSQLNVSFE